MFDKGKKQYKVISTLLIIMGLAGFSLMLYEGITILGIIIFLIYLIFMGLFVKKNIFAKEIFGGLFLMFVVFAFVDLFDPNVLVEDISFEVLFWLINLALAYYLIKSKHLTYYFYESKYKGLEKVSEHTKNNRIKKAKATYNKLLSIYVFVIILAVLIYSLYSSQNFELYTYVVFGLLVASSVAIFFKRSVALSFATLLSGFNLIDFIKLINYQLSFAVTVLSLLSIVAIAYFTYTVLFDENLVFYQYYFSSARNELVELTESE